MTDPIDDRDLDRDAGGRPGFRSERAARPQRQPLGPFAVDQVVRVMTEVSNSPGTRTSAVRTITIEEPIG